MFDLAAQLYLKPRPDSFWRWSEKGQVACWRDGATIAFREELLTVLEPLVADGLPPLEGVLLVLAATQRSWPEQSRALLENFEELIESEDQRKIIAVNFGLLDRVNLLEDSLRISLEAKQSLISLVFEGGRRIGPKVSAHVITELESGLDEAAQEEPNESISLISICRALGWLAGLERVDPDVLGLRSETGLDELPVPVPLELSPAERIRLLVKELDQDDELAGVARLARNLMAAVTLPRRVSQHEELPLGGVSDITNRGPLDRLLLSELAHDDTTLAVRVAVGEALYLRRESPPRSPPRARAMLLECGVRSWGIPRVFSTAVALALGATADPESELFVYRAEADQLEIADLTTKDGLVEHLGVLRPEAHPGLALPAFARKLEELGEAIEPLLVTTEDAAADPEFRRALDEHGGPLLLALVDREGHMRLLERSPHGSKLIRAAQFDVEQLLEQRKPKRLPLVDDQLAHGLPAIFGVRPFPLRFAVQPRPGSFWNLHGHVLCITRDQRLVRWTSAKYGAEQIADCLPRGQLQWAQWWAMRGMARAVVGNLQAGNLRLLLIDLPQRSVRGVRLELTKGQEYEYVTSHNGGLFVISPERIEVFDRDGTRLSDDRQIPELNDIVWMSHRFFFDRKLGRWLALSFDGAGLRLEPVLSGAVAGRAPRLLSMFEWSNRKIIGITSEGRFFDTQTGDLTTIHHGLKGSVVCFGTSQDGSHVVLRQQSSLEGAVVDVATRSVRRVTQCSSVLVEPQPLFRIPQRTVRSRLLAMRRCGEHLQVLSRNGRWHEFVYLPSTDIIQLRSASSAPAGKAVEFKPLDHPAVEGYRLSVAPLPDRACAYVDSRGLLHLKTEDEALSDLTLVLQDSCISGWWARNGGVFGDPFFTGDTTQTVSTREIYETLARFCRYLPDH